MLVTSTQEISVVQLIAVAYILLSAKQTDAIVQISFKEIKYYINSNCYHHILVACLMDLSISPM